MKVMKLCIITASLAASAAGIRIAAADPGTFADELLSIQREFDEASFAGLAKSDRRDAFEALVAHAADFSARHPDRVEAVAWNGIVLSSYAGEVSALGAMKYAKAAREALHRAEAMAPAALDGGLYASLGALYSKVPGGIVGFGDAALAGEYFEKALAVDGDNIDTNYFYGEYLLKQEDFARAESVLRRALATPAVTTRPLFDAGRRTAIREMLQAAEKGGS